MKKKNIKVPVSVMNSDAYKAASAHAKNLLLEIAVQLHHKPNGDLIATWSLLQATGRWKSPVTAFRARKELVKLKLVIESNHGGSHKPQTYQLPACWEIETSLRKICASPQKDRGKN